MSKFENKKLMYLEYHNRRVQYQKEDFSNVPATFQDLRGPRGMIGPIKRNLVNPRTSTTRIDPLLQRHTHYSSYVYFAGSCRGHYTLLDWCRVVVGVLYDVRQEAAVLGSWNVRVAILLVP